MISRFSSYVTADKIKSELLSDKEDKKITKLVTKHPTYVAFNIRMLDVLIEEVLQSNLARWYFG